MKEKKKIGFVYYDDIHHIHHFISAFAVLFANDKFIVEIITYKEDHFYLKSLLKKYNIPENVIVYTDTFLYRKIINILNKRKYPSPFFLVRKNKKKLLSYDVLVFNDANHDFLINKRKGVKPKFAFLDHGAGDGDYIYNDKITNFDLITVAGKKVFNMCVSSADFSKVNIKICGYQKFESTKNLYNNIKLFNNDNPTIIYSPHFKRNISSYYTVGTKVLDFFIENNHYNLIFAPHINLFNKKGFLKKIFFDNKYMTAKNIHIDFGSEKSVDMTYTLAADIYLGDVSSQVYEFLSNPRPCIFINSYNINWQENKHYQNWHLGKVIKSLDNFNAILDNANTWHKKAYLTKQKEAVKYTFDVSKDKTASERIANEIIKIIE